MHEEYTPVSEPRFDGYYEKVNSFYDTLRNMQGDMPARVAASGGPDAFALETWKQLCSLDDKL